MNGIEAGTIFQAGKYAVRVLYADNHLLMVEKSPNMPVQADSSGDTDLLSACKELIRRECAKPGDVYLGLVHRLDRPVGGAVVFARTSKAASRLSEAFRLHTTEKLYYCVAQGTITQETTLHDTLLSDEASGFTRVVGQGTPGGKDAFLTVIPLAQRNGTTLCEVHLGTGRKHQIRVQLANFGHPLWGDARYGQGKPGQQLALWAYSLTVPHPTTKLPVRVCSYPPARGIWQEYAEFLAQREEN